MTTMAVPVLDLVASGTVFSIAKMNCGLGGQSCWAIINCLHILLLAASATVPSQFFIVTLHPKSAHLEPSFVSLNPFVFWLMRVWILFWFWLCQHGSDSACIRTAVIWYWNVLVSATPDHRPGAKRCDNTESFWRITFTCITAIVYT